MYPLHFIQTEGGKSVCGKVSLEPIPAGITFAPSEHSVICIFFLLIKLLWPQFLGLRTLLKTKSSCLIMC